MTKTKQEILFILDRSGSMEPHRQDVIGGFNSYLRQVAEDEHAAEIETNVSLVTFNQRREIVFSRVQLNTVERLTEQSFRPNGSTALLDAFVSSVNQFAESIGQGDFAAEKSDDAPSVLCVVFTDGHENASRLHTKEDVAKTIEKYENLGNWTFVYLGANQDAWSEAGGMAWSPGSTTNIDMNDPQKVFEYMAKNTTRFRREMSTKQMKRTDNFLAEKDADLSKGKGEVTKKEVDKII